ncbi:hypothetical protein L1887_15397 [Cichorium endivia]|nr:hypothetical protein L1887_15397 [Cichorium endivia]
MGISNNKSDQKHTCNTVVVTGQARTAATRDSSDGDGNDRRKPVGDSCDWRSSSCQRYLRLEKQRPAEIHECLYNYVAVEICS